MAAAKSPQECPACAFLTRDVEDLRKTQKNRPCGENSNKIKTLEESDADQWTAINELRRTVWGWKGGMALASFLGGILGTGLMTLLIHHFMKGG